jgi:hypothetical protein
VSNRRRGGGKKRELVSSVMRVLRLKNSLKSKIGNLFLEFQARFLVVKVKLRDFGVQEVEFFFQSFELGSEFFLTLKRAFLFAESNRNEEKKKERRNIKN